MERRMDHGHKVGDDQGFGKGEDPSVTERRDISIFLGDQKKKLRAGGEKPYDLISEFQKTKKNRSPVVPLTLAVIVLVVGLGSWGITRIIDQRTKQITVDIKNFEDLNLRDLLDSAKRYNDDLDRVARELSVLQADMQNEIASVENKRKSDTDLLVAMNLAPTERDARQKTIDGEAKQATAAIQKRYASKIEAKRQEIAALQEKLAAYDTKSMDQAKKQQEALDNQQKIYEMEKQKLNDFYTARIASLEKSITQEKANSNKRLQDALDQLTKKHQQDLADLTARYNPTWAADDGINGPIASYGNPPPPSSYPLVIKSLPPYSPVDRQTVQRALGVANDIHSLVSKLQSVPYINSIPPTLGAIDSALSLFGAQYLSLLQASSDGIASREEKIGQLRTNISNLQDQIAGLRGRLSDFSGALTAYVRSINVSGIVIDGKNANRILLFMDPQYVDDSLPGRKAWIFRNENESVAEIQISRDGDVVMGTKVPSSPDSTIESFDKVVLQLTTPQEVTP
jgi:phage host-nuclease inhibitor protein Gam